VKKEKFIDVEKIIASKNPKLLKWLPGFLLRYIKRILHEDEVNVFFAEHGEKRNVVFAQTVMDFFDLKLVFNGVENIPAENGCIIASNHPLGGLDGLAFMIAVSRKRSDMLFPVNDILLSLGTMNEIFIPVNKHGTQNALAQIEETYRSDKAVLIFPAGLVSRKQGGKILDLEWKKSFIAKAIQYNKPIIPVHIEGKNSNWFYNLARWRKFFGIKANIEMFYLCDEMFRQRNKTITITFGKAIDPKFFDRSRSHKEWAQIVKEQVYAIGEGRKGPIY
jgi:putative hemolysin